MSKKVSKITNQVVDRLQEKFGPGVKINVQKVFETNAVYTGISLVLPDTTAVPTICVEKLPKDASAEELADRIAGVYHQILQQPASKRVIQFPTSKKEVLSNVTMQVVNSKLNKEMLDASPHISFLDLAAVFRLTLSHAKLRHESFLITNDAMEHFGLTVPELEANARKNNIEMFGVRLYNMDELNRANHLRDNLPPNPFEQAKFGSGLNSLTTEEGINGAALLLFPEILEKLGEKAGTDYFIIPFNIHELSLIRDEGEQELPMLKKMIWRCNRDPMFTSKEKILSDNIYRYRILTKRLEIASK